MKHLALITISVMLLGGNAEAARLNWNIYADEQEFRDKLDAANLDEKIKDELFFAYVDYNAASTKLKELMELNGLNKTKPAPKSISADAICTASASTAAKTLLELPERCLICHIS